MKFSVEKIIERIKSMLSSSELESLGITPQMVSNWKARNNTPKTESLYKIAKYLHVSMEWLLTGEESDNSLPPDIQKTVAKMLTLSPEQREPLNAIIMAQVEFWRNK